MKLNNAFLTAEWRKLAIANYAIDPKLLHPYLPYKTEIDLWNDKCFVSLVGFRFINTRIKGFGIPFHRHFEEINLRFYVRFKTGDGWKRGVTFIKEIVPRYALTFVANTFYKEKYITLPTSHSWQFQDGKLSVSYKWKYKRYWNNFSVTAENKSIPISQGSEEEFITEHYWGYTRLKKDITSEYGVEHPRWEMYPIIGSTIDVEFGKLYGGEFDFLKNQQPSSLMLAEGSEIIVRSMNRIK
jgi:uncharacterized protein YqjF (DUF2071 family)